MPGVDAETFAASGGRGTGANSNFAPDLRNALPQTNKTDKSLDLPCTVILHMRAPVTHAEVAAVVRGGTLTQIFLKRWNKEAHVSFVRGEDAAAFFEWAKNNDFRIQGKRVSTSFYSSLSSCLMLSLAASLHLSPILLASARITDICYLRQAKVSWSQNSWKPAGYIRGQVEAGKLTRNILIQRAHSGVTEAAVRKQLEHIHNLEVLSVKVDGDEVRISTNCVQGALFAKTCMMSRSMYKGMWIGFYPDECAEPLPDTPGPGYINEPRSKAPVVPKGPLYNPYEVLSEDDMFPGETGSEGDDEHEEEETDDDF